MTATLFEEPQNVALQLGSRRGRILLVDEDAADCEYYQQILEAAGFQVRPSSSFLEAILCLDHESFDFIVVDHSTGNRQWRAVLESAGEPHRRIPVLVVTRFHDMVCYLEAMQLGAVDYLEKPLTVGQLAHVLETHLPPYHSAA